MSSRDEREVVVVMNEKHRLACTAVLTIMACVHFAIGAVSAPAVGAKLPHIRDCPECPEMVVVPPGKFMMGTPDINGLLDEKPYHEVAIGYSFAVGTYEVTFEEWDACVTAGGCRGYRPDDEGWGRGTRPVINISWDDAQSYVAWLSARTGKKYRLLSEAEWEYVARAGTETRYFFGNDVSLLCQYANGLDASVEGKAIGALSGKNDACSDGYGMITAPVGSYRPNPWGLYDILGNVSEWVEDRYIPTYDGEGYRGAPADGAAWLRAQPPCGRYFRAGMWREDNKCAMRVTRGGDWSSTPAGLTAYSRLGYFQIDRLTFIGLRVARDVVQSERP